ncbi:MAG: hypothetical protein OZ922_16900 [Myxococcales bacterium]|jgi:hypothetical protein|nr:hypothetical protein [Myxococcales bacterium]
MAISNPVRTRRRAGAAGAVLLALSLAAAPVGADPCLDDVVSFTMGQNGGYNAGAGGTPNLLPGIVLGAPRGLGLNAGSLDVVSLGNGGSITVAFTDNRIIDGPGPDFTIFENAFESPGLGIFTEVGVVAVSEDGVNFVEFPHGAGGQDLFGLAGRTPVYANVETNAIDPRDPAVSGGDQFDLATVGLASARYLRITDPGAAIDDVGNHFPTPGVGKSGFDLDAVVAIHSEDTCAACCDADGDGSVKANDVLLLLRAASALPNGIGLCGAAPCEGRSCGDADDDRALTAADALLCLRLASGLPTPFALCSTGDCDFE